jgi:membrane protein
MASVRANLRIWVKLFGRAGREFLRDEIPTVAASIAFYALLAFFPAVAAFVSLYGLFANVQTASQHLSYLQGFLPDNVLHFVVDEMVRASLTHTATLSLVFSLNFIVSIWSATSGVQALINGLNVAYGQKETRGIFAYYLLSLKITATALVGFILAFWMIVVMPAGKPQGESSFPEVLRWLTVWAANVAVLSAIYRYAPNREHRIAQRVLPGSLTASTAWVLVSLAFSWYVSSVAHYDQTYGPLGAVIGFMMWLWLGVVVVLFGAEVNAEAELMRNADWR